MAEVRILFVADVVGKPGRYILSQMARRLKYKFQIDFVIANTENAAGGFGITPEMARKVFSYGVDCQTSGNHIWDRNGIADFLRKEDRFIRPANYPQEAPGIGHYIGNTEAGKIAVVSLMGRTYMYNIDCPFQTADKLLQQIDPETKLIIVDMHAEATSEKQSMAYYLDGRVTAVIGTHTHVQTADEQISEKGTAYVTDIGMTGAFDSILGMKKEPALGRFISGMPRRLSVAENDIRISGVILTADSESGRALSIERFCLELDLSIPLRDPDSEEVVNAGENNRWEDNSEAD